MQLRRLPNRFLTVGSPPPELRERAFESEKDLVWPSKQHPRLNERIFARLRVNASWLIKLRWVATCGQLATIIGVGQLLQIELPVLPLSAAIAVTLVSNAALAYAYQRAALRVDTASHWRQSNFVLSLVMGLDLCSLTLMLYFTGGLNNPFSFFYFVNLSLCAMVLPPPHAWALTLVSVAGFSVLLYDFIPLASTELMAPLPSIRELGRVSILHAGLFMAFSTCASVIVSFMTRLNDELRQNEVGLWEAEANQARNEKLQALGTLAAGAAHELSTPLSTIAVVAREVENEIKALAPQHDLAEDIELIRNELDRCRSILDRMSAEAGQAAGEGLQALRLGDLLAEVLDNFPARDRVRVSCERGAEEFTVDVPKSVLAQAIRGLVKNAVDASPANQPVELIASRAGNRFRLVVRDRGHGMPAEVLNRVSEPFFTTKEPGKGMGLGVFLARSVVEQLGGSLYLQSEPHRGTEAILEVPQLRRRPSTPAPLPPPDHDSHYPT